MDVLFLFMNFSYKLKTTNGSTSKDRWHSDETDFIRNVIVDEIVDGKVVNVLDLCFHSASLEAVQLTSQ